MRFVGVAMLLALLAGSAAEATVYVWNDPQGTLVMTNVATDVPGDADASVTTYTAATGSDAGQAAAGREGLLPAEQAARAPTRQGEQPPTAAQASPQQGEQPPAAARALSQPAQQPAVAARAPSRSLSAAAQPDPAVASVAPDAPSRALAPGAAGGASQRTRGQTSTDLLRAAAVSPTQRATVDPRSLIDPAAQEEPPRVFVSVVSPSTRPLSTSDKVTSLSSDQPQGMSGGASPPAASQLGGGSPSSRIGSGGSAR